MSRRVTIASFIILSCAILVASVCAPQTEAIAAPPVQKKSPRPLTMRQLADLCLPGVVSLTVYDADGAPTVTGSGFVVAKNIVATNLHVINPAHSIKVRFHNGRTEMSPGTVGYDISRDLCLLNVNTGGVAPLRFADGNSAGIGDTVVALGSPEGLGGTMSTGIISAFRSPNGIKIIQTTAPISHGSSGGPLLDEYGRVLGVTSFTLEEGQNLNFAYSSYYVRQLLKARWEKVAVWDSIFEDRARSTQTSSATPTETPSAPIVSTNEKPADNSAFEATASPKAAAAADYIKQGDSLHEAGKEEAAVAAYTSAIEAEPQNAIAYNGRGYAFATLEQYEKALADLTKAIQLKPDYGNAYTNRAYIYNVLKKYDESIIDSTEAIRLDPKDTDAYNNRAYAYSLLEQYDKAIVDLTKNISLNGETSANYNDRGKAYYYLKQYDKAVVDLTKAFQLGPEKADISSIYYYRGRSYYALKQYTKAVADLTSVLRIDSEDAPSYGIRGSAYLALKQYDKALFDYNKYLELRPNASMSPKVRQAVAELKKYQKRK